MGMPFKPFVGFLAEIRGKELTLRHVCGVRALRNFSKLTFGRPAANKTREETPSFLT